MPSSCRYQIQGSFNCLITERGSLDTPNASSEPGLISGELDHDSTEHKMATVKINGRRMNLAGEKGPQHSSSVDRRRGIGLKECAVQGVRIAMRTPPASGPAHRDGWFAREAITTVALHR